MGVEELTNRDVDEGLVEDHHLGVLVNVEALPWSWYVTCRLQELPVGKQRRAFDLFSHWRYSVISDKILT